MGFKAVQGGSFGVMQPASLCTVREVTIGDLEVLIELGVRTFNETFAHLNNAEDMDAYLSSAFEPNQVASEIADAQSTFLLAEVGTLAVGYAKLHRGIAPECVSGERSIELARLYVTQEMHGRGVAQTLMQDMVERSHREGFDTIWLGVWEHNERAKAFYSKWGFLETGSHIFQLGSDPQTDLIMERSLQA
jgi:ribosomal protein S18 acetylase RimI-like enzyme